MVPAGRAGVRRFLARFAGEQLEVALEATTGWRFLVEELRAAGAVVHLAEPAESAALRGNKKRAKSDRADARHHRELLLAGRLPESWIPPDHILDLRALARLCHTLIEQHCQWQQRIQAVLYHHGCPHRRRLMEGDGPQWLDAQPLPATARQQVTVALAVIDMLEREIDPVDRDLPGYARRQTGCQALIDTYYGIGELTAVTIVAELGDDALAPRAARQAAALARPTVLHDTRPPVIWPLDPGFGCAVPNQFRPARNRQRPTSNPSRAPSPHSHRCAAAGSRTTAAGTPPTCTA